MIGFGYHADIVNRFPTICGGVVLLPRVVNSSFHEGLVQLFTFEQRAVKENIGTIALSELETLSAWRGAFRTFGVDPTKYRSAAEALLRRLIKKGDIPGINTLVDICNLVSIRYALPVAAFDARRLTGILRVRFADGTESFSAHDQEGWEHPKPGEVIFQDEAGLVFARRWCWKQSRESVVGEDTESAVIVIEALHKAARPMIEVALDDLLELIAQFLDADFQRGVVGVDRLEIRSE